MDESWLVQQDSGEPKTGLFAKLDCAKVLLQLLKVLQFKEDVVIHATPNGIKITAEVSKCFFASAFVQKETFAEYSAVPPGSGGGQEEDDDEIVFSVSLLTLVHCLNVCGGGAGAAAHGQNAMCWTANSSSNVNASLLLHHPDSGQPLHLWIEESGIITGASIPTLDLGDEGGFDFAAVTDRDIVARIIITAEHLCDVFSEFDAKTDLIEFKVCPEKQTLSMSTSSAMIDFSVEIPLDSEMVSHAQVDGFLASHYQFQMLKHALKPIAMAEKVSIRFDSSHFLSIQYMIKLNEPSAAAACFMEFYCAPEVD